MGSASRKYHHKAVNRGSALSSWSILEGDCLDVLPTLGTFDAIVTDLMAGVAGEHLVCADLLMQGYKAFMAEQCCPYDVAVDVDGRLIRIQVKSTRAPRAIPQRVGHYPAYMWHVRRAGKNGCRTYLSGEFDMLALVALDTKQIAYASPSKQKQTIHVRSHRDTGSRGNNGGGRSGKSFSEMTFASALREVAGDV